MSLLLSTLAIALACSIVGAVFAYIYTMWKLRLCLYCKYFTVAYETGYNTWWPYCIRKRKFLDKPKILCFSFEERPGDP